MDQSQPVTIVSAPDLPAGMREKQDRPSKKLGQDACCKNCKAPIFRKRQTNEWHYRDGDEE